MEIFRLLPIDWQAVAAIMTFLAVAVALYSSYQYRKRERTIEKREIMERIIRPLEENINSLLSAWSGWYSPYFSNWKLNWYDIQKENPYLVFRLPIGFKHLLDSFDENLDKFMNLTNQRLPKLKKIIADIIREEMSLLVGEENVLNSYYQGRVGGKYFSISFLTLLLANKSIDEYLERLKRDPALPNTELYEAQFIVYGFSERFSKEKFDEVFSHIKSQIENDTELKNYIESWIMVIDKTKNLAVEIKKYEV